jgi:hypothetical protein
MKGRPLLLDLDLDFLWDRDCYLNCNEVGLAYSPEEVGKNLLKLKKSQTTVHLIVDHQESLYIWDKLNVREACCVHIDGHHDMWRFNWREKTIPRGLRGSNVGCGSYLSQAITDGVVKEVIYVAPKYKYVCNEESDIRDELGSLRNITVMKWNNFLKTMHLLPKADVITIAVSPEWSPHYFWPEMKTVCEILGVSKYSMNRRRKQANAKWKMANAKSLTKRCKIKQLDFQFPYSCI